MAAHVIRVSLETLAGLVQRKWSNTCAKNGERTESRRHTEKRDVPMTARSYAVHGHASLADMTRSGRLRSDDIDQLLYLSLRGKPVLREKTDESR
jgi:hypothetical protein